MNQPPDRLRAATTLFVSSLFVATLLVAGLVGGPAFAAAPVLAGKTDCAWGAPDCNPCVQDVVGSMNSIRPRGDVVGFHMNTASDVNLFNHWQGIQRISLGGARFLAISRSVENADALFVMVHLGSRDQDGRRFRSNRLSRGHNANDVVPAPIDGVTIQVPRLPDFHHAGGMQALGKYLTVGVERARVQNPQTGEIVDPGASKALFYDLSDPRFPSRMTTEIDHSNLADAAGATLIGRLADGRILFGIGRGDSAIIDFYVSTGSDIETTGFVHFDTWDKDELRTEIGDDDFGDYQSLNLVTQCDGTQFLVGTHQNGFSQQDFADTFRLENGAGDDVVITKVAAKHVVCDDLGEAQCNLDAAAGIYIDPDGQILLYATEHDNDGPGGTVKMREFRPAPHASCTNVRDAWVELFADHSFSGRSLMLDFVDRNLRDYSDFDNTEDFGDVPSSAFFCLPEGLTLRLREHNGFRGGQRDLVGSGAFDSSLHDLDDIGFGDETSSAEWIGGPFADAGPDQTVECRGASTTAIVNGTGSSDVNNAPLSFHWTSADANFEASAAPVTVAHFLPGTATIALTVDNGSATNTDEAILRSEDTLAPSIACPAPATVECVAPGGTPASDPGAAAFLDGASATDLCDTSVTIAHDAAGFFPLGSTTVGFSATDDAGLRDTCGSTLTVVDSTGPAIDPAFAVSPAILRVPDHTVVPITVSNLVTIEACQPDVQIECAIASSEPADVAGGDGHALPDMFLDGAAIAGTTSGFRPVTTSGGTGSLTLALRAERDARGAGRVYTLTCRATDASGNLGAESSVTVVVPLAARTIKDSLGVPAVGALPGLSTAPPALPGSGAIVAPAPPARPRRGKAVKAPSPRP